jgi:hypothetical protein
MGKSIYPSTAYTDFLGKEKVSTIGELVFTANGVTWLFNHGQVEFSLLLRRYRTTFDS